MRFKTVLIIRILDLFFLTSLLIPILLLSIPLLIIGTCTFGNPLFFQERLGRNLKTFYIIKFRTLSTEFSKPSTFYNYIRLTGLDELPQFINILKGEMSLVGPRPIYPEYLDLMYGQELKRFEVLPGITGLAQVLGRNYLSWEEKFSRDILFVSNYSLRLYFKILMLTPFTLISFKDGKPNKLSKLRYKRAY